MKAIVYTQYGSPDVLELKEVARPEPKADQILVKIHATSANALDYRRFEKISAMDRFMEEKIFKTVGKVIGADIAGVVEEVGSNVKQFRPGDEVFGVASGLKGGFAEYACSTEKMLAIKPGNLSFEAAAAVPVAATTALLGLRDKGRIQPGQKVLIYGATGGVGTFSVQIAKAFDTEVTAVCSTRNMEMVRSIGADHVINYVEEDFTQGNIFYDLVFAVNGFRPLSSYQRVLKPQGTYICAGGSISQILQAMFIGPFMSRRNGKRLTSMGIATVRQKDLLYLKELLEERVITPVIEKNFPLSEAPSAIRYLAEGHAKAKIVFQVG
jgi:NADPH:quinone reductase-like Zn-dependent oxidoreductase